MVDIRIEMNARDVLRALKKLEEKQSDFTEELQDIGIVALRSVDLNYEEQGRPDKWRVTKAAQLRNGKTLIDTGRLRRSTQVTSSSGTPSNPDLIYLLTKSKLTLGTEVPYYVYLHEEFRALIIQDEDVEVFHQIIIDSLLEGFRRY